jgi:hypothetical protein
MPAPLSPENAKVATADDIEDLFNQGDEGDKEDKTPVKEDKADKVDKEIKKGKEDKEEGFEEEEEDEKDDEDEIELKDEEDEDDLEKLDLKKEDDIEIDAPPRKKEITKEFPEFFKKFPFMEKLLYRDKQYTELFGSFDDAKEVAEKVEILNNFESQLLSGKTDEILKNVKETDGKAFDKIVDDYLPALARVDKDAYFEVVGNVTKQLIVEMVNEAKKSDNDELRQAALMINQFIFGSAEFVAPKPRVIQNKDEETNKVEQERLNYIRERFDDSRNDLQNRVDNILKNTISEYIDPKGHMTAYEKKNAIKDALEDLNSVLGKDSSLKRNLDKLWKASLDEKFSKSSLDKIQSAYLGVAKRNLAASIKKARVEALKDKTPRSRQEKEEEKEDKEEKEERTPRKGNIIAGKPSQQRSKTPMEKGESVADYFARD